MAFQGQSINYIPSHYESQKNSSIKQSLVSSIDREKLHQALQGDMELIYHLMVLWDAEAGLLQKQGLNVERLEPEDLIQASHCIENIRENSEIKKGRFLPQTVNAASLLLTLLDPEQIVALPEYVRTQSHLYPQHERVPLTIYSGSVNEEHIYRNKPDLAFVASYSLPSTVSALEKQGIDLCFLDQTDSIAGIQENILRVGELCAVPQKAHLLSLFIQSAMAALDNRLILAKQEAYSNPKRPLYLSYYTRYYTPSKNILQGELLKRAKLDSLLASSLHEHERKIPLSKEEIHHLAPDYLYLSTPQDNSIAHSFFNDPTFQEIPAVRNGQVHLIDESVQESPNHFVVLAYYDLLSPLIEYKAANHGS